MASVSVWPHNFHTAAHETFLLERGSYGSVDLVKCGANVYLRVKFDLFWAHARGMRGFGALASGTYVNADTGVDVYIAVNPWYYAIPFLRKISGSLRTEEDIRLSIKECDCKVASLLADCPITRCPGLASRVCDGEPAFQFKEEEYMKYCIGKVHLLTASPMIGSVCRAIEFCTQFIDPPVIQRIRQELGVPEDTPPVDAKSLAKKERKAAGRTAAAQQARGEKTAPKAGPIDAFLKTVKR